MKALVFDGQLHLRDDYPLPSRANEVLVRVRRAGICNTDIEITRGYADFHGVLGHEFVGESLDGTPARRLPADARTPGRAALRDVPLTAGTRVVGEINASDGTCATCLRGDVTHCENRTVLGIHSRDGALAEFLTLPARNLHRVPDAVSDAQAAFVEPLAAALEITDRVHVKPTDRVAVIGDGKLGLLCAQVLHLTGCDLIVIGRHQSKLDILARRGIATTREPEKLARRFDIVVDCTGQASGFDRARKILRPRGTLVLKSTFHGEQEMQFAPIVVDEISIVGSRCGPFEPALRLLEKKMVEVDSMLDAEFPLTRGVEAFERAMIPGTLKVQIVMS